ncbi:hypothetical protein PsorP6_002307 [Peronosclerospora sorghi]|uniref:Uncharacterized protein n=1 Tax=Peronosclerospora sorghi TaxID=230839 RepID=A0ACC0WSB9_9STRA|nr:hypothetical protein PsorP6_002307 [Peronosclerospora sorghi]
MRCRLGGIFFHVDEFKWDNKVRTVSSMATWAALNVVERGHSHVAQEEATEEARDADNTAMYEQALRYQQRHETARATALYVHLLERDVRLTRRLEYLCHKNLATMALEAQSFENALDSFASALTLDATDVVVRYQMDTTAIETGKWWLARRTSYAIYSVCVPLGCEMVLSNVLEYHLFSNLKLTIKIYVGAYGELLSLCD